MEENGIKTDAALSSFATEWQDEAKTLSFFSDTQVLSVTAISDQMKAVVAGSKQLHSMGIELHTQTGDNENSARAIASSAGIGFRQVPCLRIKTII